MPKDYYIKAWSRDYTVQYCEVPLRCYGSESKPHTPSPIDDAFFFPEQGNEAFYVNNKEWEGLHTKLGSILHQPKKLRIVINNLHFYGKKYENFGKLFPASKLKNLNNEQLIKIYREYFKLWVTYCTYLALMLVLNNLAADEGKKILNNKKINNSGINDALFSPLKKVGILELQDRLLKLKSKPNSATIEKLLKKFAWMSCLDLHNQPWTIKDLKHLLKHLNPQPKTISFNGAALQAGLNADQKSFFILLKELIYLKDMRDVYRRKGIYNILPLFEEIARRFKSTRKQVAYLTSAEIILGLKNSGNVDMSAAKKREKGFILYKKYGQIIASTNTKELKYFKNKITQEDSFSQEAKGTPASAGKAKGKARIVLNIKDIHKIKTGDILVAVTTHPDFVPAMQKCAAIITDEGGLTSHAAIVSRELRKPCIVGTKVATQVFKDGDMVEVDANKGIVKKI